MYEIVPMPLGDRFTRARVQEFLSANGLKLDPCDEYLAAVDDDSRIVAGGGIAGDVLKCLAVSPEMRDEGLTNKLVSRLIAIGTEKGHSNLKVFTKPGNKAIFESLGFRCIGCSERAILLENGKGLQKYLETLERHRTPGRNGVIVMNANPLTWGHDYLVRAACTDCDKLFIIPVGDEGQMFSYEERFQAISSAFLDELKVEVLPASPYAISAATFPSYFIKENSDAATAQMELDLDIFAKHIAPALGAAVRYIGTEPQDRLTAQYNAKMAEILPSLGIEVVAVPRLEEDGKPVSASTVREYIAEGNFAAADALAHPESMPMLLRSLAQKALQAELDLPGKPGLVGPDSRGAHKDMDYKTMLSSIEAISPYFHAFASINPEDDVAADMIELGIKAEKAMLSATGGVNTHKGAILCIGLAVTAYAQAYWEGEAVTGKAWRKQIVRLAEAVPKASGTHGALAVKKFKAKGALQNAREGYPDLFKNWLPYWRSFKTSQDGMLKLLCRIMSTLDDTNVLHRGGPAAAAKVKKLAAAGDLKALRALCERDSLSPGGAADMLALTLLADMLLL